MARIICGLFYALLIYKKSDRVEVAKEENVDIADEGDACDREIGINYATKNMLINK
jgi:hypothetical protein